MTPIQSCIVNKNNTKNPIWFMRQAGRYLPEFREIRKENPNFIELCLNKNLTPEITLQPLKRFELDAAIIFSDILMLPYGLGQKVEFKKNYGPSLEDLDLNKLLNVKDEDFSNKLKPVYEAINIVSKDKLLNEKDLLGFVGAPWTIFVYMLNKKSPKLAKDLKNSIFNKIQDKDMQKLLRIIVKFLKIHIKNQVESGATIIQIFDSWAGLLEEESYEDYIYNPTIELATDPPETVSSIFRLVNSFLNSDSSTSFIVLFVNSLSAKKLSCTLQITSTIAFPIPKIFILSFLCFSWSFSIRITSGANFTS